MRAENRRHIAEGSKRVGGTGQQSQVRGGWGREPLRRHKRNRPVWILCLIWGVTFAGASAVGELHTTDKLVEIHVKLYQGYIIVVQGSIGKLQKLNFVIDTGAVPSVVDSRVAQKLGLNGMSNSLSVFSRNVPTEELVVPNIELGAIRAVSVRALSQDLSFIEKALGVRIDALIGLDVLGQSNFTIDYESKRIAFGIPMSAPDTPAGVAHHYAAFESEPGFAVVQIQVQGQFFRLVLDTGSSDLVLFRARVQDRLPALRVTGAMTKITMGGEEDLPVVELVGVRLGSADLPGQHADLISGGAPASAGLDGLLGVTSLDVKRIAFDFEHRIIRWDCSSRRQPESRNKIP
jgi:predicted aspartyl protease